MPAPEEPLESLIAAVAQGDRQAFRRLFDRASGLVHGTARRILRDGALAEDAAQNTFVKIWRAAASFDPIRGRAEPWIAIIARRCALDLIPANREMEPIENQEIAIEPEAIPDPGLRRCLKLLSPEHRNALLLTYVYGLTHEELAESLGIPLGTAKSRVRRAAAAMKECLDQ
jgi:RNA polymerase sigma-70 factor (ECF subfamily)